MKIKITPGTARGSVTAPPSKSLAHRFLICAAMADGVSKIKRVPECDDVLATIDCLASLGIKVEKSGDTVTVYGRRPEELAPTGKLYCRESASTLRFMIPVAMLSGQTTVFSGGESLMRRPMEVYRSLFSECGLTYLEDSGLITVKGPLLGGDYTVPGDVSSQFISGLLFALPLAEGESRIRITHTIESRPYIELTLAALRTFGVTAEWEDGQTIYIPEGQRYSARKLTVEGDWSGAAYIGALSYLGGEVDVMELDKGSLQGDAICTRCFEALSSGMTTINIADTPDLAPILFALSAAKHGGVFEGTRRLTIKESDRAAAMANELAKLGAKVEVCENEVKVLPSCLHAPSEPLCAHGDHRIAMALSVLLTLLGGELDGAEAVAKSYPEFFGHLSALGIKIEYK